MNGRSYFAFLFFYICRYKSYRPVIFIKNNEISAFFAGSGYNLQNACLMARDAF